MADGCSPCSVVAMVVQATTPVGIVYIQSMQIEPLVLLSVVLAALDGGNVQIIKAMQNQNGWTQKSRSCAQSYLGASMLLSSRPRYKTYNSKVNC